MEMGICRELTPSQRDNFFAESKARQNAAKKVCNRCPVKAYCYTYALDHNEEGIWGGTNEAERRQDRRFLRMILSGNTSPTPDTSTGFAAFAAALESL